MTCPICLDEYADYKLRVCGHIFHKECISKWNNIEPTCPLCRTVCIMSFPYTYNHFPIKKGYIIIKENSIIINNNCLFSFLCKQRFKIIPFNIIKRVEYTRLYVRIIYIKNHMPKIKYIYTRNPIGLFNSCKFHILKKQSYI